MGRPIENEDAGPQREDIEDSDEGFDVNIFRDASGKSEDERPEDRKESGQDIPVRSAVAKQKREGGPQGDKLRKREIDKDDPPLKHMDAEVCMDENEHDTPE